MTRICKIIKPHLQRMFLILVNVASVGKSRRGVQCGGGTVVGCFATARDERTFGGKHQCSLLIRACPPNAP